MISPTPRQADLLRFVAGFIEAHGRAPSFAQMVEGIRAAGKGRVAELIHGLEERGLIQRDTTKRRIMIIDAPPLPRAPDGAPLYFINVGSAR